MKFKPLSQVILASVIATTSVGSGASGIASASENAPKTGDVAKSNTKENTSKPLDFDKAKNMSPEDLKSQLTDKDKKLHDKDINDSGSKDAVNDRNSSSSAFRSATPNVRTFSAQQNVNSYIKNKNLKPAKIKEDSRIGNLPKYNYKSGKYVGVVVHETANPNSTLSGEVNYMYNNYNNAFVHAYVDGNEIRQTAPADYLAWGAGANANPYFYQVELVRAHSFDEFAKSVNNDAYLTAYMLKRNGLKPSLADNNGGKGTVISHNAVSKYYGGSDHTDPISYFNQWGYDMNQYFEMVQYHYNKLNGTTNAPTDKISGSTHKVVKGDTLYNISKRSGVSVKNLKKYNNLKSNTLSIGQTLKLKDNSSIIKGSTHKVVSGDTLYNISKRSGVSIDNLKKWNGLKSNKISKGQTLYLVPSHKVKKGETLYRIAISNNMSVDKLKKINNLKSNTIKIGQMLKLK